MPPIQYIVEGGHRLAGTIEPSGNKNSALPIIAAALLTEHPVTLENVPRIRDTETLVELIRSVGASAEWKERNTLAIHAREVRAADLDPELREQVKQEVDRRLAASAGGAGAAKADAGETADERARRQVISAALEQAKWRREKAAEILGVSPRTLYRWIKRLGL